LEYSIISSSTVFLIGGRHRDFTNFWKEDRRKERGKRKEREVEVEERDEV
jgi:hypothetical protein